MIVHFFLYFWVIITSVAAIITLPGSVELLTLSLAALPSARKSKVRDLAERWGVAVVVPAHNEELSIAGCVESLLKAKPEGEEFGIFVIADNCTDNTATVARNAGALVLERNNDAERGKGYALHYAFTSPEVLPYNCVLIVDADTSVAPDFVTLASNTLRNGAAAVQARYIARNAEDTTRTRLMALALRAFNVVRPRGRQNLGLSVGVFGNGFGLSRATLDAVPYLASSVVEDLEYHLSLVRSGRRVQFLDETTVFGEMPVRGKGVETQRSRWEGGRLRTLFDQAPVLFGDILRGRLRCIEPLFDLLLLPLAFHVMLLLVASLAPSILAREAGVIGLGIVIVHLTVTIVIGDEGWRDLITLASAPLYILWKLLLIPKLFRSAKARQAWVRTERNEEAEDK